MTSKLDNLLKNLVNELTTSQSSTPGSSRPSKSRKSRRSRTRRNNGGNSRSSIAMAPSSGTSIVRRSPMTPFLSTRGESTIVRNTEAAVNVATTAAFTVTDIYMHPAFNPWIATVAQNFSKFRYLSLRYIYIPSCPTTTAGTLVLGPTYDVTDNAPLTNGALQAAYHSVTTPYWAGYEGAPLLNSHMTPESRCPGAICVEIDVSRFGNSFYRFQSSGDILAFSAPEQDVFVPGRLWIATNGGPAVAIGAGTLFVQYDIELIEPITAAQNA